MQPTHTIQSTYHIGVISDTHGVVPSQVHPLFKDLDLIIHAGDIDRPEVLDILSDLAPVKAVRGNMDRGAWTEDLAAFEVFEAGVHSIGVLHDVQMLNLKTAGAGLHIVISGHTHQARVERRQGVLFINPGSAVYPRYGEPPSVVHLTLQEGTAEARILTLSN